jgi:hypothetical protein
MAPKTDTLYRCSGERARFLNYPEERGQAYLYRATTPMLAMVADFVIDGTAQT